MLQDAIAIDININLNDTQYRYISYCLLFMIVFLMLRCTSPLEYQELNFFLAKLPEVKCHHTAEYTKVFKGLCTRSP